MNRREHRAIVRAYRDATFSGASHQQAMSVLVQAAQQAIQGGPQAVQRFMQAQGFPQDGAWCGQFAAAVVRSTGSIPPTHPEIASNWRNFGTPTNTPHAGDVAIRRATGSFGGRQVSTGSEGSHVTFVGGIDPQTGRFTGVGGNQGATNQSPTAIGQYPISGFEFRTPSPGVDIPPPSSPPTSVMPGGYYGPPGPAPTPQPSTAPAPAAPSIPSMDIPFAVPPQMPNNVPPAPTATPPAIPTGQIANDISFAAPQPSSVPPPQQRSADAFSQFQPTDYTQLSPSPYYGQGYDQQGFAIPTGGDNFNSVTGTYQDTPQSSQYVANFDLTGGAQSQAYQGVPTMDLGGFSQSTGTNFYTDPSTGMQYVFGQDGNMYPAFSGREMQPALNIGGDLSLNTPSSNTNQDQIASAGTITDNPFSDPSWTTPTSDSSPGTVTDNPFADPSWLPQGPVDSFQSGPPTYDPLAQGSIGQSGGVPTVQGTIIGDNGMYMRFDPTTGTYQPTGVMAQSTGAFGTGATGGFGVGTGAFGVTPAGFSMGYTPFGGGGVGPQFSPGGAGVDTATDIMHGGVDPTGGSGSGQPYAGFTTAVSEAGDPTAGFFDTGRGAKIAARMGTTPDALGTAYDQTVAARAAAQPRQYISGYTWYKNPGMGQGGFSQKRVNFGQTAVDQAASSFNPRGWWTPTYTIDPSLAVTAPTTPGWQYDPNFSFGATPPTAPVSPEHLATGGAIDLAQWMSRKSGKVPGVDHGVDEVHALLRPKEVVFNLSQLKGLKIGNPQHLRKDQIAAIKGAQRKKAA